VAGSPNRSRDVVQKIADRLAHRIRHPEIVGEGHRLEDHEVEKAIERKDEAVRNLQGIVGVVVLVLLAVKLAQGVVFALVQGALFLRGRGGAAIKKGQQQG
jgi:hypothetical protein